MDIEVWSDGSATTSDKPGGYGWVMLIDNVKYSEGSGHMPNATNNDAELLGAIEGLRAAYRFIENPTVDLSSKIRPVFFRVTLISDSQLILGWVTGKYTFRQENKMEQYKQLKLLVESMGVQTRWVEGHTGDEHNERCDKLANEARLQVNKQQEKIESMKNGETLIGTKKTGVVCLWYKGVLKVVNFDDNVVENYDRLIHGPRGSMLEIREEKSR